MNTARKSFGSLMLILLLAVGLLAGCASDGANESSPAGGSGLSASTAPPLDSPPPSPDASSSPASSAPASVESPSAPEFGSSPTGRVTAARLADFQTGWTGGKGWIAGTKDGGRSWNVLHRPEGSVHQLFALDRKQVWATLDTGDASRLKLIGSGDGGITWRVIGEVPNQGFLHFVSSSEAFSGNARSTDGGKSWRTLRIPDHTVGDPYFHDLNNGWVVLVGEDKFTFSHSADGGKTWHTALSRKIFSPVNGAVIRSTGKNDVWIELIGDSGMTQTSYSLFHTADGGKSWLPVLAHSGAGSGPAPGYEMNSESKVPKNKGTSPGALYVVNPATAFMGGQCLACDNPNTLGKTTDGGKTWTDLKAEFPGYGPQLLVAADAEHLWWINTDHEQPSVMYISSNGGDSWDKVYSFGTPEEAD